MSDGVDSTNVACVACGTIETITTAVNKGCAMQRRGTVGRRRVLSSDTACLVTIIVTLNLCLATALLLLVTDDWVDHILI